MSLRSGSVPDVQWRQAWTRLCHCRRHWPANAGVWDLRWRGGDDVYRQVTAGRWHLQPLSVLTRRDGTSGVVWSAPDALVLKWLALHLAAVLPVHPACTHVAGRGGVTGARQRAFRLTRRPDLLYGYFFRTDIQGYYRHITAAAIPTIRSG